MKVSVAICTWNRSKLLDLTLNELRQLQIPKGTEWELLIVNNNCTDDTDKIIAKHQAHLPIRRLLETKQGHSNARNCAVAAAEGDLVLWTDDDVLIPPHWLAEYVRVAEEHPEAAYFGGPVLPWFEGEPPRWLKTCWDRVNNAYAMRDFSEPEAPLSPSYLPYGANFGLRTYLQRRFLYDPTLGHNGTGLMGGDETTVLRALIAEGHSGWSVPRAAVRHWIPRDRQTVNFLFKRFQGIATCQARDLEPDQSPTLFGKPRWLIRRAIQSSLKFRWNRMVKKPEIWMENLIEASSWWGKMACYPRKVSAKESAENITTSDTLVSARSE